MLTWRSESEGEIGSLARLVLAGLFCAVVGAGEAASSEGDAVEQQSLNGLAWMTGYWIGSDEGSEAEECWLGPKGGLMLGVHRDVNESGSAFFEYLRIEQTAEGIVYFASPGGREATAFALAETSERRVVFENPAHDFPRRISYWLDEDAALHARVEGEKKGLAAAAEWIWRRRALD
jgi:hypothetical protein